LKIKGYALFSGMIGLLLLTLMTPQIHAQPLSPLEVDQDGDGDPINEESDLKWDCDFDHTFGAELGESMESTFGDQWETPPPTLSEDDCNFAMHYLSGQCEELTAKGANVTQVCDSSLRDYLSTKSLYTKDFPTDTERFNSVLDEFRQNEASEEQESASREANKPSWAENLD
jgi:hypothetical protein